MEEKVNAVIKSLKWLCNQIPNDLGDSNEERMLKCIRLYCDNAVNIIEDLFSENKRLKVELLLADKIHSVMLEDYFNDE